MKTAGRFLDQRRRGRERIISITIAYEEVALMQIWVESTHWLLVKKEAIPTEHLINRKGDIDIFGTDKHIFSERRRPEKVKKSLTDKCKFKNVWPLANQQMWHRC